VPALSEFTLLAANQTQGAKSAGITISISYEDGMKDYDLYLILKQGNWITAPYLLELLETLQVDDKVGEGGFEWGTVTN
jgi:hypothetical protein